LQLSDYLTSSLTLTTNQSLCLCVKDNEDPALALGTQDLRYYTRVVRNASNSTTSSPTPTSELIDADTDQFLKDLVRFTKVYKNQILVERSEYAALLEDWSNLIAVNNNIPLPFVTGILTNFNQSFGNANLCFWNQFIPDCKYKGQDILMFRTLQQSPECTQVLELNNNELKLCFTLPLQAFSAIPEYTRDADNLEVDLTYQATLTCDFSLPSTDTNFIKHTVTIEVNNPDLTVSIKNKEAFANKCDFVVTSNLRTRNVIA
jgi:hypothetical protein